MNPSFGCGHIMGENVELCAALQRLKDEHPPLRKQMDHFFVKAKEIMALGESEEFFSRMNELHKLVVDFEKDLGPHSDREEGILFPAMVKYIGREAGPIAVMEYEHEQAKKNIKAFLDGTAELTETMNQNQLKEVANYAVQAYLILTDHFMKEESVLFPMAQRILTEEEKEKLLYDFSTLTI